MNKVTIKRQYAGSYQIEVFGIQFSLEETNQSCCGKGVSPLWVLLYDGIYDVLKCDSKRNAMEFLKYHTTKEDLMRRINDR